MATKKQTKGKVRTKGADKKPEVTVHPSAVVKKETETSIPPDPERKDHVLQTRVPKNLYDELVEKARRLRVPVSNLVRNILEDSVRMVENIVDNSLDIAESFSEKTRKRAFSRVLGWQPLAANRKLVCARCHASIQKGSNAFISIGAPDARHFILCEKCKNEM